MPSSVKLAFLSHLTIDLLRLKGFQTISMGGPPCYGGLTARNLGCKIKIVTKFGYDFNDEYFTWLSRNGIDFAREGISLYPTTTFLSVQTSGRRRLYLKARCEDLSPSQLENIDADGLVVSPVAGEISMRVLEKAHSLDAETLIDPQGFLRHFGPSGLVSLKSPKSKSFLDYADFLKVDERESSAITSLSFRDALRALGRKVHGIIATQGPRGAFFVKGEKGYRVTPPKTKVLDRTGAGDILSAAFMATYLKSRDFVWSACLGVASASLSLQRVALSKIPESKAALESAQSLFERVKPFEL